MSRPQRIHAKGKHSMYTSKGNCDVYACRMVNKVSSKGKLLPRVILLLRSTICMMNQRRVRRFVNLQNLDRAEWQERDGAMYLRIVCTNDDEPDFLFAQTETLEEGAPAGTDTRSLVALISQLRGRPLPMEGKQGKPPLDERTCSLRKPPGYNPRLKFEEIKEEGKREDKDTGSVGHVSLVEQGAGPDGVLTPDVPVLGPPPTGFGRRPQHGAPAVAGEEPPPARGLDKTPPAAAPITQPLRHPHPPQTQYSPEQQQQHYTGPIAAPPTTQRTQPKRPPLNKCLCIAIGYLGTQYVLPRAGHDAKMAVKAFENLGFFKRKAGTPDPPGFRLLSDCIDGSFAPQSQSDQGGGGHHHHPHHRSSTQPLPTKRNIMEAVEWLVSDCEPGDSLLLIYVGHCRHVAPSADSADGYRDGPNEAVYPLDFDQTAHPSGGVIPETQLSAAILPKLEKGISLTVVCDACSGGCMLNLPYKLKAGLDGSLKATTENVPSAQTRGGKVVQISGYRDPTVAPSPQVAAGGVIAGLCAALSSMKRAGRVRDKVEYNATFEDVLLSMRQVVLGMHGAGGQLPQVAAVPKGNSQDLFFSVFLPDSGELASLEQLRMQPHASGGGQWAPSPPREPPTPAYSSLQRGHSDISHQGGGGGGPPGLAGQMSVQSGVGFADTLKPLPPPTLRAQLPPSILESKGLADLLAVRSSANGAVPEIYFASEVISVEVRPVDQHVETSPVVTWPTAKVLLVGRDAIYLLDPNGEMDRCIPMQDISDYILLKAGVPIEQVMTPQPVAGSVVTAGSSPHHWLAVRVPSKYELLFQPVDKDDGLSPQTHIQQFLHVVNELVQHGNPALLGTGEPAQVLVIDRDGPITPGLLRLLRPQHFNYPFVPLHVTFFPDSQAGRHSVAGHSHTHSAHQQPEVQYYAPSRFSTVTV